jgi:N-acetylglucosaminyl-diphospho-decaprenol L-rhamnosyltransferase
MDVSILIVTYNAANFIGTCLRSIYSHNIGLRFEVIVVDNASKDGSPQFIRRHFQQVKLIENAKNLGFAKAANIAYEKSRSEFCLFMNPDIIIQPGSIRNLWEYLLDHHDVAIVFPKLYNIDGSLQYSCRTFYTIPIVLLRRTSLGKLFPNSKIVRDHLMMNWDHNTPRAIDWALGASMMVRKSAVGNAKPFDERFFLYFEDVDLCYRMKMAGWSVMYNPEAEMIHHHVRHSAGKGLHRAKIQHLKSWIQFMFKHTWR